MESGLFTLVGVIVGATLSYFLTRSNQHAQWLRDNRKQEYRELLSGLSDAYLHIVGNAPGLAWEKERQQLAQRLQTESFKVLHDRIFIAGEIKNAGIMPQWLNVINLCNIQGNQLQSQNEFSALTAKLVEMALNDPRDILWWNRRKKLAHV